MNLKFKKPELTNFAAFGKKDILTNRWSGEKTIDSIRLCYKNQIGIKKSRLIGPVCLSTLLFLRLGTPIGNFAVNFTYEFKKLRSIFDQWSKFYLILNAQHEIQTLKVINCRSYRIQNKVWFFLNI